jgi:putative ABC transport system substrate-binding protein
VRRREFISLLGGAVAWPIAARAQQPAMPVIGFLGSSWPADRARLVTAFRQGLRETGHVEGQNVTIEYRWAQDQYDRLPNLAAELVRRDVAVIAAHDTLSAIAAKSAATTIPIVFATGGDPVRDGLVANLNRPGSNITGVSFIAVELGAKQVGLLRELRAGHARIAVLVDPKWPITEQFVSELSAAASAIGHQIEVLYASSGGEIDTVFASLSQKPPDALLVGPKKRLGRTRKIQDFIEERRL